MRALVGRCSHHSLLRQFRKVEPIRGLILQSGPLTSSRGTGLAAYRIGRGGLGMVLYRPIIGFPSDESSRRLRKTSNPRSNLRGGETRRDCLISWSAWIRGNASRQAVIGRAKDDCLIGTDCRQSQNRCRAGHQEQRTRTGAGALAKVNDQRFLRSLVQPLLHHVDDQQGWPVCFECLFATR